MAAPLHTLPSASKEELLDACRAIQSARGCSRRPIDALALACGGLRPLYSGSPVEAEIVAAVNALLSPPASDSSWHRRASARYVPDAQNDVLECGALDSLVAALGFPSALNKPAIARCIARAVGLQSRQISRAVDMGVVPFLFQAMSNALQSGDLNSNFSWFAMALEALADSNVRAQNAAESAGFCGLLINAILNLIAGACHDTVHYFLWAIMAMCHDNINVLSSFARAGAPSAAVRALASCTKMSTAEAALDVLCLYIHLREAPCLESQVASSNLNTAVAVVNTKSFDHTKLATGALLTSDEAVARLAVFARAASKHAKPDGLKAALSVMLAAATVDFSATSSVLERSRLKIIHSNSQSTSTSNCDSALAQACIASLMNDRCPQLCIDVLAKLVPISAFALEVLNRGGVAVLFARLFSNNSLHMTKRVLTTLVSLSTQHEAQFVSTLEQMLWLEISRAIEAVIQMMNRNVEIRNDYELLDNAVQLLQTFSVLPASFHFRLMSFMLSSQAIEVVFRSVINSHFCSVLEYRSVVLNALRFVLKLMEFDLSIKPAHDSKSSMSKVQSAVAGEFVEDVGNYQSAASLADVAPSLPDLLNLLASCIGSLHIESHAGNPESNQVHDSVSSSSIGSNNIHLAILRCILKILTFLVDNPLAADVMGAAGGVELLMKLFLFGEEEHKPAAITILRMLHAHNDKNRQILARLIGKLPSASSKSLSKSLLKDERPWLRSPPKPISNIASKVQSSIRSSSATCDLPSVIFGRHSAPQSETHNGTTHIERKKHRSQSVLHQFSKSSTIPPSGTHSAAPLPFLMPALSKLFECYSSSERMSGKHLRKFFHDFCVKDSDSRVIMRCHAEFLEASGQEDLSFSAFVDLLSCACNALQTTCNQFLAEIGAKNARSISIIVDAARERSTVSQKLQQTKRIVCSQVDEWRDRQNMKRQNPQSPPIIEHKFRTQQLAAPESQQQLSLKTCGTHNIIEKDTKLLRFPPARNLQVSKRIQQGKIHILPRGSHIQRSRPKNEAALWAEFGCQFLE